MIFMVNAFLFLLIFLLFALIQSLVINGIKMCFDKEEILYPLRKLIDRIVKNEWARKPFYSCVKCMSSIYGGLTYWGVVVPVFGFHHCEIPVFLFDVFTLVYLNYFFYKRQ